MSPGMHLLLRAVHIALGFGSFGLGAVVALLPKFGANSAWHRRLGRIYAVCMLGMAGISVPLAWRMGNAVLFTIGLLTLGWVTGGWLAIRAARAARGAGRRRSLLLHLHLSLMGSSYIAAWTAFLVTNRPFGTSPALSLFYALTPTLIGSLLIARANINLSRRATPVSASVPHAST